MSLQSLFLRFQPPPWPYAPSSAALAKLCFACTLHPCPDCAPHAACSTDAPLRKRSQSCLLVTSPVKLLMESFGCFWVLLRFGPKVIHSEFFTAVLAHLLPQLMFGDCITSLATPQSPLLKTSLGKDRVDTLLPTLGSLLGPLLILFLPLMWVYFFCWFERPALCKTML